MLLIILVCCMSRGFLVTISPNLVINFLQSFCLQCTHFNYLYASVSTGATAAVAGEALKDKHHENGVVATGGQFYPLIVETFGLWIPFGKRL